MNLIEWPAILEVIILSQYKLRSVTTISVVQSAFCYFNAISIYISPALIKLSKLQYDLFSDVQCQL